MPDHDDDDFALDMSERFMPGRPVSGRPELDKIQKGFATSQWLVREGIHEADPVAAVERMARKAKR